MQTSSKPAILPPLSVDMFAPAIRLDRDYSVAGKPVKILSNTLPGIYPVLVQTDDVGHTLLYTATGKCQDPQYQYLVEIQHTVWYALYWSKKHNYPDVTRKPFLTYDAAIAHQKNSIDPVYKARFMKWIELPRTRPEGL